MGEKSLLTEIVKPCNDREWKRGMTSSARNKSSALHNFQKHNSKLLPREPVWVIEIIHMNCTLGSYLEFQGHYFTCEAHKSGD